MLGSLASVPQPGALVSELQSRLVAASAAAGVPSASAMDLSTAAGLLGREAANSFGVRHGGILRQLFRAGLIAAPVR